MTAGRWVFEAAVFVFGDVHPAESNTSAVNPLTSIDNEGTRILRSGPSGCWARRKLGLYAFLAHPVFDRLRAFLSRLLSECAAAGERNGQQPGGQQCGDRPMT